MAVALGLCLTQVNIVILSLCFFSLASLGLQPVVLTLTGQDHNSGPLSMCHVISCHMFTFFNAIAEGG